MSEVKHLSPADFQAATAKGVVLIDFSATWCGPCKMMEPILKQVAAEIGDAAKVYKVDVDESQALAAQFGITNIPALCVLKNGTEVTRFTGVQGKAKLVEALKNA